jgi:L-lactate dehydrogenase complex protein LldG
MLGVSQDEFIRAVRDALADRGKPVEPPAGREVARVVKKTDDIVGKFCAMAVDAKMKLYRVADESAVPETVVGILMSINARTALINEEPLPNRDALIAAIRAAGCTLLDLREKDSPFEADAGITGVRLAVAETGSIVVTSGPQTRRLASLAVPEHIAIVRAEQIVPDLLDWAATLGPAMPANEVLITGPSKTADIEMNLVMGVHGPRNVHIILIG